MTNEEQIIELLREIRDLQRSHLERHLEFTQQVLEVERQQEQARQAREDANRAELRRATYGLWVILAIALLILCFLRPLGDWLLAVFDS
jgi:hypothetical protein